MPTGSGVISRNRTRPPIDDRPAAPESTRALPSPPFAVAFAGGDVDAARGLPPGSFVAGLQRQSRRRDACRALAVASLDLDMLGRPCISIDRIVSKGDAASAARGRERAESSSAVCATFMPRPRRGPRLDQHREADLLGIAIASASSDRRGAHTTGMPRSRAVRASICRPPDMAWLRRLMMLCSSGSANRAFLTEAVTRSTRGGR